MALPKMQRVFAAATVAALLMAGAPGRAEAAGTGTASGGAADAWSSVWNWALRQLPVLRLWLGEDEGTDSDNEHRRGRPAWVPGPPEVDKGSGLDPNGGGGGGGG